MVLKGNMVAGAVFMSQPFELSKPSLWSLFFFFLLKIVAKLGNAQAPPKFSGNTPEILARGV